MTILIQIDADGTVQCSECDSRFLITFDPNPIYDQVEFCPFCGEDVEGSEGHSEDFEEEIF